MSENRIKKRKKLKIICHFGRRGGVIGSMSAVCDQYEIGGIGNSAD